jgi:tRNA A58 N-methylase Trm61
MGRIGYPETMYKKLQEIVIKYNPRKIIDFGTWQGTTAKAMAKVCNGHIITYDFGKIDERTEGKITYKYGDFYEWIERDPVEEFDLLYVDVHNTGRVLNLIHKHLKDRVKSGIPILFEGGIPDRDGNIPESE